MKTKLIAIALLSLSPFALAASEPVKQKALELTENYKDSVVFLSAVIEMEITAGDHPAQKEERKIEALGTVISKNGLIVVPNSTLDPAVAVDGRSVQTQAGALTLSAKSNLKEVKILLSDGTEIDARLSHKDPDLDLAFVQPQKPEEAKLTPIDISNNASLNLLDDVIILGRLNKDLNREYAVQLSQVTAIISKPRTFAMLSKQSLGQPVFNQEGKFVGIGINRMRPNEEGNQNAPTINVLLPAEDVVEAAEQAE